MRELGDKVVPYEWYLNVKKEKRTGFGNPKTAYLVKACLVSRKEHETHDDNGNVSSCSYFLSFDNEKTVEVRKAEYDEAKEGGEYYLARYKKSNAAFTCFDAELFEPGSGMDVRG